MYGESEWNVTLLEREFSPGLYSRYSVEFEAWTVDAAQSALGSQVWASNDPERERSYSATIDSGNGLHRIMDDEGRSLPRTYFSESNYFVISNQNASSSIGGGSVEGSTVYKGFRMDAANDASLVGNWQSFQYEVETTSDQLTDWGYEILELQFNADNTADFTVTETTNESELNETGSFPYSRDGGTIVIDGEAEFRLSASGDILLRQAYEGGSTALVTTFMKIVEPGDVDDQDMVGTWAMSLVELGKNHDTEFPWTTMSSESALVDLRADGSGSLYMMETSVGQMGGIGSEASLSFAWTVDGSDLLVHSPGDVNDEWARFLIGASKEVMRDARWKDDYQGEFLTFEYFVKIDAPIPPEVEFIPVFAPGVDYFGTWLASDTEIYTELWPWIHFSDLGWMYALEGNGVDLWLYDLKQHLWMVGNVDIFPFALGADEGEVYFFDLNFSNPEHRFFYSYEDEKWLE